MVIFSIILQRGRSHFSKNRNLQDLNLKKGYCDKIKNPENVSYEVRNPEISKLFNISPNSSLTHYTDLKHCCKCFKYSRNQWCFPVHHFGAAAAVAAGLFLPFFTCWRHLSPGLYSLLQFSILGLLHMLILPLISLELTDVWTGFFLFRCYSVNSFLLCTFNICCFFFRSFISYFLLLPISVERFLF